MATKRLFTAIELPDHWLEPIAKKLEALKNQGIRGRFVPLDRLHLTVNFIGETDQTERIMVELEALERPFAPLIRAGSGGFFQRRRGGDLLICEIEANRALREYQQNEKQVLTHLGFGMDPRPYHPHLTLAREVSGVDPASDWFQRSFDPLKAFYAPELVLFHSRYEGSRLTYTPLGRYAFSKREGEEDGQA